MEEALFEEMFRHARDHWWFRGRRRVLFHLIDRHLKQPGGPVLDLGCGVGTHLADLGRYGVVTGADASPSALAYCRRNFTGPLDRVLLPHLPLYRSGHFGLVAMFDVLEHIEADGEALMEVFRILAPGGLLALTVPAFPFLWSHHDKAHHHFRRYRKAGLRALLGRAGFRILRISYANFFLFPAMVLARKGLPQPSSDAPILAGGGGPLGRCLEAVFAFERHLIGHLPLPAGGSLLALAKKPEPEN
jgi:SAM-dependent methyltransferase